MFLLACASMPACGGDDEGKGVNWACECTATCPSTGEEATIAAAFCGPEDADPTDAAVEGVGECLADAKTECADATCACACARGDQECDDPMDL